MKYTPPNKIQKQALCSIKPGSIIYHEAFDSYLIVTDARRRDSGDHYENLYPADTEQFNEAAFGVCIKLSNGATYTLGLRETFLVVEGT
jgi:hypothetical protein